MRLACRSLLALLCLCASALVVGCGDDDENDEEKSCAPPDRVQALSVDCEACAEASCRGEYSSYCASSCAANDDSFACEQALGAIIACVLASCVTECSSAVGDAGGAGPRASNELSFACYVEDQGLCSASLVADGLRDTYESTCADADGVGLDRCPTENLVGCCNYTGSQTCIYDTSDQALSDETCGRTGGTWSETP